MKNGLNFVSLKLCALMGLIYLFQVMFNLDLAYAPYESESWKFFISFFAHGSTQHLLNNLFFIGVFGTLFERFVDEKSLLEVFILSAIFANTTAFIFYTNSAIIGASGGAMGILAALTVIAPKKIGLAMGVPVPMYIAFLIYVAINLIGLGVENNVAYEAHLFGMITGILYGIQVKKSKKVEKNLNKNKKNKKNSSNVSTLPTTPKPKTKNNKQSSNKKKKIKENKKEAKTDDEEQNFENWEERIKEWEKEYMRK